jgi:Protein of unknown function (DUF4231)
MKLKSPALFRRVPIPVATTSYALLPDEIEEMDEYKPLASDIAALRAELFEDFKTLDVAALRRQNGFRLGQFLMIIGGLIATLLGAVQAALPDSHWPGIAEAGLVLALALLFLANGQLRFKQDYLDQRLKAERLRAECFFFLARVGGYSALDDAGSRDLLKKRVNLIKTGSAQQ